MPGIGSQESVVGKTGRHTPIRGLVRPDLREIRGVPAAGSDVIDYNA